MAIKSLNLNKGPIDFHWNNLKFKYKWYSIKNILGKQRASYSDIEKIETNSPNLTNYNTLFY